MLLNFATTKYIHTNKLGYPASFPFCTFSKDSLRLMNQALNNLPDSDKKALYEAYDKCSELVKSNEHKIM